MPTTDPEVLAALTEVRAAVRAASRLCLRVAGGDSGHLEKAGKEPVTLADYGSQAVILSTAARRFPGHGVLAEEGTAHLIEEGGPGALVEVGRLVAEVMAEPPDDVAAAIDHAGGDGRLVWAVDPIDGTKGFLRGDQFAVAVGILDGATPAAGVLGCPRTTLGGVTGVLVWGGPGIGAFVEPLDGGEPQPIEVSDVAEPAGVRVLGSVESAHGDPAVITAVIERAGLGGGWVRWDSQAKYAAVAAGVAETYIRPRNREDWRERVWDHAAGAAIVTAAGGRVTDLDGQDLDFTTGRTLEDNRGVLVTNGGAHEMILEALAAVGG
jgi:3'(2'), 5'-bisphosphate nucleotidase